MSLSGLSQTVAMQLRGVLRANSATFDDHVVGNVNKSCRASLVRDLVPVCSLFLVLAGWYAMASRSWKLFLGTERIAIAGEP